MCNVNLVENSCRLDEECYRRFVADYKNLDNSIGSLKEDYGRKPYYRFRQRLLDEEGFTRGRRAKYYSYSRRHGAFAVVKRFGDDVRFFGYYKTEDTARRVVDYLKKCDWDKSQLDLMIHFFTGV